MSDPPPRPPRTPIATPEGGIPRKNPAPHEAELLARILEVVPSGIAEIAHDGAILRANKTAQGFLGLSWDELSKRFIGDFAGETFHEDGSPCPVDDYPVTQCLRTGTAAGPATIGVRKPSGELRWGIFTATPLIAPDAASGAVVTFVDITDRRRAEVRSRAHDRLLDTVRIVHFREDPGATIAVFQEPLSCFLELTRSKFGFIASIDKTSDDAELRIHARIDEHTPRGGSTQPPVAPDALSRAVLGDGERRVFDRPGPLGGPFMRREPQVAAVLPLTTAGRVVGVVGLADAPRGYDELQLDDLEPLLVACADLVVAFEERRDRRQLETQLAQAERLASVGTLAAGMAHEINNPLAYVLLNLQAFTRQTDILAASLRRLREQLTELFGERETKALLTSVGLADGEARVQRVREHGRDASEGAERVQRIVRDLMTFSRVSEERKMLVDINEALEVALKMADHEIKYRARLTRELGDIDPVLGNDGRISQVFLNLLINAARAIEEGHPDENGIRVRTWMQGREVMIEVSDTGEGVTEEHLPHLFEPFFTTRSAGAGSGLGLSICHNIVSSHGGRIEVESEVGIGSRFLVCLPSAEGERERQAPPPRARPVQAMGRRRRILLIDDEPMVLRVLAHLLSRSYEVECADGYLTATTKLEYDASFDVVLCDMMMLDGTGVDVHSWVSEHRPELVPRMIFMTGGTFTPKARTFLSSAGAQQLVKPFSLRELDEMVSSVAR